MNKIQDMVLALDYLSKESSFESLNQGLVAIFDTIANSLIVYKKNFIIYFGPVYCLDIHNVKMNLKRTILSVAYIQIPKKGVFAFGIHSHPQKPKI